MPDLFETTDADGDKLDVYTPVTPGRRAENRKDTAVTVRMIDGRTRHRIGVHLSAEAVDRLIAAVTPYGTSATAPADRPWAVGDEAIVTKDHPLMARLYEGDRVRVVPKPRYGGDRDVYVEFVSGRGERFHNSRGWCVYPEHLRRPDIEPAPALEIEHGKEYKLLPGATYTSGGGDTHDVVFAQYGPTRVEVLSGPDGDGDYWVTAVDGTRPGLNGHVTPRFLAPLDAPKSEPEPTAAVTLTPEEAVASLNPRRMAAVTFAAELLGTGLLGSRSAEGIVTLAEFVLGEGEKAA